MYLFSVVFEKIIKLVYIVIKNAPAKFRHSLVRVVNSYKLYSEEF